MSANRVLIVDDEADMRHLIDMYLGNSGFECLHAETGIEAYQILEDEKIDVIILDVMMPFENGFEICENIRQTSHTPIIFLSAKGEEWDKVKGLQTGGDDYIVKPFSPGELIARIQAVLRRFGHASSALEHEKYRIGKLTIDKKARKVMLNEQSISLTLKEYELLSFFIEHQTHALSREQLLENVWGMDYDGSLRTVDTHVKTLRMKLGAADYIQTVWGVGYKFEVPSR